MTLIEKLSRGEVYVKNDCTPEEMLSILKLAFPKSETIYLERVQDILFDEDYYGGECAAGVNASFDQEWIQYYPIEIKYQKAISSAEFLNQINETK